ncbi:sensor histidine kinase [Fulvivirga lutimaris]|uniref:sensor histidine kinase n=1 Tax=Fulvivirga lutimaris TaxID=1819566 RepID=UPI0012BC9CA9|nr:PAS domain-containing sensor histidine kinase [Fulvivirga lutimaris]MTI41358.1 PAS domain S-box protein [Fulvivirga lutimaris]
MSENKDYSGKELVTTDTFGVWALEKRVKLTRSIAYIGLIVSTIYPIIDYLNEAYQYIPYYFILITGSIASLVLLRFGKYTASKMVLLLSGVALVTILASWEVQDTGVFMYFFVVAVGSLTLFGANEKISSLIIVIASITAFYIVYFTNLVQFEKLPLTQDYIELSFFINFSICVIALITMVFYILSINKRYEEKMYNSQTQLIELTKELTESRQRFELAIQGSSVGIWDWDVQSDHLFISPLLLKILDYTDEKLVGVTSERLFRILHPDDKERFETALNEHFDKSTPFRIECRLKKADGSYIWVLDTGQAQWDKKGTPIRMVGTVLDIDDRRKAFKTVEEQNELLAKTNEELDRFVYSTSHDLKAPLSSILGLINVAEMSNDPKEFGDILSRMRKRVGALNGFIAEIIDYSRNTRLEVESSSINLKDLIVEVIDGLKYYEDSQRIDIKIEFDDDLLISSDRGRLKIILNNLIANAIKYHNTSQENPFIKIQWDFKEGLGVIKIVDNGTGIDDSLQDKVFNMFFRATESSEGSGLGLYIAKEMTEKISGQLSFESNIGEGTTFFIHIPYKPILEKVTTTQIR